MLLFPKLIIGKSNEGHTSPHAEGWPKAGVRLILKYILIK